MSYSGKFMFQNWIMLDGTTITVDQAETGDKVIANLIDTDPDLTFATESFQAVVTVNLPSVQAVDAFVLAGATLGISSSVEYSFNNDGAVKASGTIGGQKPIAGVYEFNYASLNYGGYPADAEIDPLFPDTSEILTETAFVNQLVFTITNDGPISLYHIMAGPLFAPEHSFENGSGLDLPINANLIRAPSGNKYFRYDPEEVDAVLQWEYLSDSEARQLNQGIRFAIKKQSLVFASLYAGGNDTRQYHHELVGIPVDFQAAKPTNNSEIGENAASLTIIGQN